MSTIRYILLSILLLALCPVKAQDEMEINWSAYAQDSVVPVFAHSIDLGYDYDGTYNVAIEYPELKPLTTNEIARFRLPKRNGAPEWPEITVHKGISAKRGQLDVSFQPIIWRDGKYWRIHSFTLKVHREASIKRSQAASNADRYASHSVLSTGNWVKIRVADNGIHMLTHANLRNMGFENPSKVRLFGYGGHLLSEENTSQWRDDLCEVGVWRGGDRILFYANGPVKWTLESDNTFTHTRNPYSDFGYYFLTDMEGPSASKGIEEQGRSGERGAVVYTTPAYALHEIDDYAWFHGGRKLVESYDYLNGNTRSYSLNTYNVYTQNKAVLDVCFTHNASATTSLSVGMNGTTLSTSALIPITEHDEATENTHSHTANLAGSSQHTVTLTHHRNAGISGRLDYLRLSYTRYNGLGMPIYATGAGMKTYEVYGANANTVVWRITDASSPVRMSTTLNGSALTFTDDSKQGDMYVAFDPYASYAVPETIGEITNQDLHATGPMDYIIIVPANGRLMSQAERLAQLHREHRGLAVKVVRADEVYNEFSSGTPDATAYRRYLKMLYDRASSAHEAPKYLLLFGDGAWDNRMLSPAWSGMSPDDYLLCYEAESSLNAVESYVVEDYFGLLDDGEGANLKIDKVDIGVGRFPVTTVAQARETVDKVADYINNAHAGAWKNTILMLGDDGDKNRHMDDAELVAQMIEIEYPEYMVKRIYWDAFPMEATSTGNSYPVVRKRLLELFRDGALMVNYSGHGAPDVLSHELVINKKDMEKLSSPRLPLWVTVSCDITPFDNSESSLGEAAFLNPKGGAIGLLTSTRTTYAEQNKRVNYFFSKYVLARDDEGRRLSMGDAIRLAKCNLITTDDASLVDRSGNKLNYVLIGDPALIVGGAEHRMVVDELNGMPTKDGGEVLLKAGSEVVVRGHVAAMDGALSTDFSGLLYASVFDNLEDVICRNNANAKDDEGKVLAPFTYRERTKKFFVGSDSVRNGQFSFTFRVPMDINYSMENGLINLYAINSTRVQEAKGMCDGFLLGGTADNLANNGSGPNIQVYFNSTNFKPGDKVNETPFLMVYLEDEDGINIAGNIGHSLTAIIDGKASMTYNLDEYYVSDIGGYTRGSLSYALPEIPEGKHQLMFRAWDMMNNSSTVTVDFEVVKGLAPEILHIYATPNPARDYTTFMVTHDRPESDMVMTIEVFDFSGRILWTHSEEEFPLTSTYSYTWDLRSSSGQPLETGMYLYRVIASSPMGQSSSKAQKLMIKR